ncbi:RNA polymerase sigma factor [Parapedobacter indicus]|uniref:RNA polymerase sigma-70 factor, ECF subfamily n=1 Tax=Parapedobacter indicus TaxID=1477437 RepID=A0A1I3FZG2_9SPHI|nr:sigma-70 family RNA polymerase sigma factor [Parapedobacter indicus]PPL03961.1 RNA polymerase sigma-70 factor (ECF subfamily) [Parapedobacter indicus]SFI16594.1 RNA polymerase sigma-70 factor, ECF subfamily [Parapedobacter indicus]
MDTSGQLAAHFFREHSGRMVASLARVYGMEHLDAILDAVQDTFETALTHWRYHGPPHHPRAWLSRVARNKLINALKHASRHHHVGDTEALLHDVSTTDPDPWPADEANTDGQLQLLVACCHPALGERDRIIITLHILCGFGIPELANALQMKTEAVKKAVQRSKALLRQKTPNLRQLNLADAARQSPTVCTILYLVFNEGYKATRNAKGIDFDLCYEALRLAKLLHTAAPAEAEVDALLVLMFFGVARFPARLVAYGDWIPLEDQNRSLWDQQLIAEGFRYLDQAQHSGYAGNYYLEALIASHHCAAPDFEATDWKAIHHLYQLLENLEPASTLIRLNRLIAKSYAIGPLPVITELETIAVDGTPGIAFLLAATKAHVYQRAGNTTRARAAYEEALSLAQNPLDSQLIRKRMEAI